MLGLGLGQGKGVISLVQHSLALRLTSYAIVHVLVMKYPYLQGLLCVECSSKGKGKGQGQGQGQGLGQGKGTERNLKVVPQMIFPSAVVSVTYMQRVKSGRIRLQV